MAMARPPRIPRLKLGHETRGLGTGSPWCEADQEATHAQKRMCVECGRYAFQLQDMRCVHCLGLVASDEKDSRVAYYSRALRRLLVTGLMTRRAATAWANALGGRVEVASQEPEQEQEMPNVDDMFPSKYLKAEDLKGRKVQVQIEQVAVESLGQGADARDKLVLYFKGKDKGMVLNKTNSLMLSDIFSSKDTDNWIGHPILLTPTRTTFQGKPVMAIRVEEAPRQQQRQQVAPPPPEPEPHTNDDDAVPF